MKIFLHQQKAGKSLKQAKKLITQCFVHSTPKGRDKTSIRFKAKFRASKPGNSLNDHRQGKMALPCCERFIQGINKKLHQITILTTTMEL